MYFGPSTLSTLADVEILGSSCPLRGCSSTSPISSPRPVLRSRYCGRLPRSSSRARGRVFHSPLAPRVQGYLTSRYPSGDFRIEIVIHCSTSDVPVCCRAVLITYDALLAATGRVIWNAISGMDETHTPLIDKATYLVSLRCARRA